MSTLAEIEAAVPTLTLEELMQLRRFLESLTRERTTACFTGRDAISWWRAHERLSENEAESFAADIAAGRAEIEAPVDRWE